MAPAAILASGVIAVYITIFRPGYLTSEYYLGGLILLQIVLAAVWNFRRWFFVLLMAVFLAAGISVPYQGTWTSVRWFVLAVGAVAGFAICIRDRRYPLGTFHLIAIFAVLAALISAVVSVYPAIAILKALSLLLLFLYASSGGRLALVGREAIFAFRLSQASEILVYLSAALYLVFNFPLYGNPNSLGAVMGIVFVPALVWASMTCEDPRLQRRWTAALLVSVLLLLFSQARAAIAGGAVSCFLLYVSVRRYRRLAVAASAALVIATVSLAITPEGHYENGMPVRRAGASLTSHYIYKDEQRNETGVFSSRESAWQQAIHAIKAHPWFGSGFGTDSGNGRQHTQSGDFSSNAAITHEHGNSYLAMAEWMGLLGAIPFVVLVLLVIANIGRVLRWLRAGGDPRNPIVPIALILASALVHAGFEDWLLAVGYYVSVFFWVLAFGMVDLVNMLHPIRTRDPILNGGRISWIRPLTATFHQQ